jgi:phage shock protein E
MRHTTPRSRRRQLVGAALAASTLVVLAGCGGEVATESVAEAAATAMPDYGLVTPEQAAELAAGGVTLIDVRTPEEFAEGHIEGALLIDLSSDTFTDRIAELDPDQQYLVYCRSDNRSGQAVAIMRELGLERVWDLDGGVVAYTAAGLPLVR